MKIKRLKEDPLILTTIEVERLASGSVVQDIVLSSFWMRYDEGFLVSLRDGTTITLMSASKGPWRHRPDATCVV